MKFETLLNKSDYEWYKEEFNRDERGKLSDEEMEKIIWKSVQTAEESFQKMKLDINEIGIEGLINYYGTEIQYNTANDSNRLIAMYDRDNNLLIIFEHSINTLYDRIKNLGIEDKLSKDILKNLIIAHELYHIIEMNETDVYTYSKIYESKFLGFSRKKRIRAASEIGAFHFSKLVTGVNFSPCIIGSLQKI